LFPRATSPSKRLRKVDTARAATSDEVKDLRRERSAAVSERMARIDQLAAPVEVDRVDVGAVLICKVREAVAPLSAGFGAADTHFDIGERRQLADAKPRISSLE
jgi:hypothetical protein